MKSRLERTRGAREKARQEKNQYKQRALAAETKAETLQNLVVETLSAWLYSDTPEELWSRFTDGLGNQLTDACPQVPSFNTQPPLPEEEEAQDETETL